MSDIPDWWELAEAEIDEVVIGFTEGLKAKLVQLGDKPMSLLGRKNPFLFRVRGRETVDGFVWSMVDALLSSRHGKNGQKSGIEGIDLEYSENSDRRVLIQVKSGKNWGNSSQIKQLKRNFEKASRVLKQEGSVRDVRCIEGISYGRRERRHLGSHERIAGPDFWQEISGWTEGWAL